MQNQNHEFKFSLCMIRPSSSNFQLSHSHFLSNMLEVQHPIGNVGFFLTERRWVIPDEILIAFGSQHSVSLGRV